MKVLIINGSPIKDGNTSLALEQMTGVFDKYDDVEYEIIEIGKKEVRGCIACNYCKEHGKCVFDDIVNETALKLQQADALITATPVYCASPNGTLVSLLDRLFYSAPFNKTMKVGAAIAVARRAGLESTVDVLNKYFTMSQMPVASSIYWNGAHGRVPGEVNADEEGLQTMRVLAENIVFLMRSIALGKEKYGLPEKEERIYTNFVR